jgi:hypothetical protein
VPLQAVTDFNFLPVDNYIISNTETGTPFFTNKVLNEQFTQTDKTVMPLSGRENNKKISIPETVNKPETEVVRETAPPVELNIARPITTMENDAAREIIITEQGSEGTSVKVYTLVFENGKWILQPELLMSNMEKMTDSLSGKMDALQRKLKKLYPDQQ